MEKLMPIQPKIHGFHLLRVIGCCLFLFICTIAMGQTKRALLIGISDYPQESIECWANIHGSNDVYMLSATLKKQGYKTKTMTNKSATASNIRRRLNAFIGSCKPGDYVYLHFSCHGQPVEDLDSDEEDGWDEAIIPYDAEKVYESGRYEGENHITDDELNGYLRRIRQTLGSTGFVYAVIDACHAGSSYRGDEDEDSVIIRGTGKGFSQSDKQYTPRIDKRGKIKIEKSGSMADICILEACRAYQVNSEIRESGQYYGSLSFYVNKVLQDVRLNKDISWTERVAQLMNRDMRLVRQNIVIEKSM